MQKTLTGKVGRLHMEKVASHQMVPLPSGENMSQSSPRWPCTDTFPRKNATFPRYGFPPPGNTVPPIAFSGKIRKYTHFVSWYITMLLTVTIKWDGFFSSYSSWRTKILRHTICPTSIKKWPLFQLSGTKEMSFTWRIGPYSGLYVT